MPKIKKTYDVFLSYASDLASQAKVIVNKFADAGLTVFDFSEIKPGYNITEEIWQALAESWAIVALVKPDIMPPSVAVEIGAASAWQKPIYILTEGEGECNVPLYFSKFEMFKASEVEKVVHLISEGLNPLSDEERLALVKAYSKLRVPTDKLFIEPGSIERLKDESGIKISGERIMQELLRLRKQGKLPRVRRTKG
ncbi:MAG: toll/interleukin-1 receptor domain-containing protein [Sedimentisphaerales bacterium]|nr:toll/interleukin-1 receptor domain-containing protein [Sedimentisphaerales bacterium]